MVRRMKLKSQVQAVKATSSLVSKRPVVFLVSEANEDCVEALLS